MNNDELKKKIVSVLHENMEYELQYYPDDNYTEGEIDYNKLADALSAAVIGDVKEIEHRVAVAERALKHAVNVYIAHTETSSQKKWWYKYFLREAEKELAKERKEALSKKIRKEMEKEGKDEQD